jgi:hypothetical protein
VETPLTTNAFSRRTNTTQQVFNKAWRQAAIKRYSGKDNARI